MTEGKKKLEAWKMMALFSAMMLVLLVVALWRTDLTPEDTRHDHFVSALWPPSKEPGKSLHFEREHAIIYKDPGRPLTWHVCTATVCGRYFEADGDAEKSR